MKITIAWNVWKNYQDTELGSEIVRLQNAEEKIFDELHLISQGGYEQSPNSQESKYLDGHFFVECPEVPLLKLHPKFQGVFRVIEGIQRAYHYAEAHGHDFAIVTNADAWILSVKKLSDLLYDPAIQHAAWSSRVGWVTGLEMNFGSRVPLMDDHFIILNIQQCKKYSVFEYDHAARFFQPHFGNFGGIHYILHCIVNQRVPRGLFYAYTALEDALGQYGDYCGWNLLPWQYQPSLGFLHANCDQMPSLHFFRAAFLHDIGLVRFPAIHRYCEQYKKNRSNFTRKRGVLVRKKSIRRLLSDGIFLSALRLYRFHFEQSIEKSLKESNIDTIRTETLRSYRKFKHIMPVRLLG